MKKLIFSFYTWSRCSKEIEVEDDYELNNLNSIELMEELMDEYSDQFETFILSDDFLDSPDNFGDIDVEQTGLDYIDSVVISDSFGNHKEEIKFEKIQYS